ncbi:MAG: EI24 domain-containing protein [Myxococcales bacterium]|nr:EI24 domain-containing protein [Myxococcales bacterium]
MNDFLEGILSYAEALKLVSRLRLWWYLIVPAVASAALGIGIFAGALALADDAARTMLAWAPWARDVPLIGVVAQMLGLLLMLGLGLIFFKQMVMAICAPVMSPLAQRVQRHLAGTTDDTSFSLARAAKELARGLAMATRNIVMEAFFFLPIFMLGVIPVLGLAAPLLAFSVQAYFAGFGNFDFALEANHSISQSVAFVRRNRWLVVGNGAAYVLLLLTGIGFLVALPLGTIAAAIATHRRL